MNTVWFFFIVSCLYSFGSMSYQAVTVVPVADLLKYSACTLFPNIPVETVYKQLPMGDELCRREYQLLLHELVEVLEEYGEEVRIRVPHIIYYDAERAVYDNTYWTLKNNIISCACLEAHNVNAALIPPAITLPANTWNRLYFIVATLYMPFTHNGVCYSAGTRFMCAEQSKKNSTLTCFALDKEQLIMKPVAIPAAICLLTLQQTQEERCSQFIALLRQWAHLSSGFIPYLYSGSSFIDICYNNDITSIETGDGNIFVREELVASPYTGFDCSCIISRAAQLCGLPYFYKDSTTIERNIKQLQEGDVMCNGDIIWFPGHVVIISDVEKALVIEARGYASGFGRVHELALDKMFKGIKTCQDLVDAFFAKQPLALLAYDGSLRYMLPHYKILTFKSALYREFRSLKIPVEQLELN